MCYWLKACFYHPYATEISKWWNWHISRRIYESSKAYNYPKWFEMWVCVSSPFNFERIGSICSFNRPWLCFHLLLLFISAEARRKAIGLLGSPLLDPFDCSAYLRAAVLVIFFVDIYKRTNRNWKNREDTTLAGAKNGIRSFYSAPPLLLSFGNISKC